MNRLLEIRSYKLKPGAGGDFHRLVSERSAPLHADWGIDVVAFGQSLHDPDAYYLMRAYKDQADLEASQAAFYGSAAWREGPREAIVALIESDANAVMWLDNDAIALLRDARGAAL
ncbi:NIPSNAP family protein [Marilutibacter alkalisoli]|uniref:NIPSNAP family protein n=1 Tax=Marilutibacter alkalisoli TaxID=2591633 RepID=A0A514BQW3_9GAMM|nr:antibiotic biosynthesis monooxygenase [Lysobacter alkalisoli]QDH69784.1 NIPSNAP family protein [Lysobacter alkalisoli]